MRGLIRWGTYLLPWVIVVGEDWAWEPKMVAWIALCVGLLAIGLFRGGSVRAPWHNQATAWLLVWIMGQAIAHFWWPYLLRRPGQPVEFNFYLWLPAINVLLAFVAVRLVSAALSEDVALPGLLTSWLCQSGAVVSLYMLGQWAGIDPWFHGRVGGTAHPYGAAFGNEGLAASYVAMTLPLCLAFTGWRALGMLALGVAAITVSQARYTWGALACGLALYGGLRGWARWPSRRGRLSLALALLLAVGAGLRIGGPALARDERMGFWRETLYQWQHVQGQAHTGSGLESFPDVFRFRRTTLRPEFLAHHPTPIHHPHNEWLNTLFELGTVGLGLTLWTLGLAWRRLWAWRRDVVGACWLASALTYLVISTMHFPWHIAPTAWQGMLVWAMAESTKGHA